MAPSDGNRSSRIPTLSWNSVVDSTDHDDPAAEAGSTRADPGADAPEPHVETPIVFEHLSLGSSAATTAPLVPPHVPAPPAAAPPPVIASPPVTTSTPAIALAPGAASTSVPAAPVTATPFVPAAPARDEVPALSVDHDDNVTVRTVPPATIVPVLGDVTSGPEMRAPSLAITAVPEIQEATPVEAVVALLPTIPAPTPRALAASPFEFDRASVVAPPFKQPQRRKKRGVMKPVITLVVLGGLVAAGVVFGKPYLFPAESEGATAPYAEAVEAVRGVDFVEPVAITAEPTAQFARRLQTQLAPTSPEELAEWRALGLANGVVDDATLAEQLAGWQDSLYSIVDRQVYQDLAAAGAELDAELVRTMAAASLDQEFRWSVDQVGRTLDAAAATSGEVIGQARVVQSGSEFAGEVPSVPTDQSAALPPVIGYRLLAPHVFAEFVTTQTPNPLLGLGLLGPGPLGDDVPVVAGAPSMVDGDVVVDSPVAKDRSFWFLVFDGFLDGPTAYAASEAIVENSLTHATRGTTACVHAVFSGGGVGQTDTLRAALAAWSGAAPAEFASAFTTLADGSLQLSSCDPGTGFTGSVRSGVAAELVAWRAVELATFEAVTAAGGDDTEFANAWALIGASNAPLEVSALPAGASPSEIARAARDAVSALYVSTG